LPNGAHHPSESDVLAQGTVESVDFREERVVQVLRVCAHGALEVARGVRNELAVSSPV
jgi:hypothetical protein